MAFAIVFEKRLRFRYSREEGRIPSISWVFNISAGWRRYALGFAHSSVAKFVHDDGYPISMTLRENISLNDEMDALCEVRKVRT